LVALLASRVIAMTAVALNELFESVVALGDGGALTPNALPTHGGVYLIADRDDRPILLSMGENLRRVVIHRLATDHADQKSRRTNLAEIAARVYWTPTFSRFETAWAHWRAVRHLNPRGYRKDLAFGPSYFLRVAQWGGPPSPPPRFTVVSEYTEDAATYVGPFATRKDADAMLQTLEDAFDLCRYYHILEQAPHGQACAYFEMGKCPAPCDGTIPLSQYQSMIADAAAFAAGHTAARLEALIGQMKSAAAAQHFEKAAAIRQTLERADAIHKRSENRFVADLSAFRWLVVQRGGPRSASPRKARVRPFFVDRGHLMRGDPVALADLDAALPAWLQASAALSPESVAGPADARAGSEIIWLVCKYLFQAERAPGLFIRRDRLPDAVELRERIIDRLSRRTTDEEAVAEPAPESSHAD
jgi:hypothetical protein